MRMGKLYLIGLGLSPDLITLRGLRKIKDVRKVYLDIYTSSFPEPLDEIKRIIGRNDIILANRSMLEERSSEIIGELEHGDVALLVTGNPLLATTHVSLLIEARNKGHSFEVVPAPGIIPNALLLAGLMIYKIGKPVTLTYPRNGIISEYPYDVIKDNDSRNLHTILLLEMDMERGIMMTIPEAVKLLFRLESIKRESVINGDRKAVAVSALGSHKQRICPRKLKELLDYEGEGPHTLILVSPKPHFMEEEALAVIGNEFCREP